MKHDGFTLIEFIVIISIFAIMASVALFNFQGFKSNVAVNNLAQDVALLVRQAQTFGWATLSDDAGGQIQLSASGDPLRFAHGIFFDHENGGFLPKIGLYKKEISDVGLEYFDDTNDSFYDTINFQGNYGIVAIKSSQLTKSSLLLGPNKEIPTNIAIADLDQDVSIAFSRPKPEALIFSPTNPVSGDYVGVYIGEINQSQTAEKVIIISKTGEIWVE